MTQAVEIFPTERFGETSASSVESLTSSRQKLYDRFADKLETAFNLNRQLVSFQANKEEPVYRWFKYKEGFSSNLVRYFLTKYSEKPGKVLDPFAGVGTTLFAGQTLGWQPHGIELLPVGIFVVEARQALHKIDPEALNKSIRNLWLDLNKIESHATHFNHISISYTITR